MQKVYNNVLLVSSMQSFRCVFINEYIFWINDSFFVGFVGNFKHALNFNNFAFQRKPDILGQIQPVYFHISSRYNIKSKLSNFK